MGVVRRAILLDSTPDCAKKCIDYLATWFRWKWPYSSKGKCRYNIPYMEILGTGIYIYRYIHIPRLISQEPTTCRYNKPVPIDPMDYNI